MIDILTKEYKETYKQVLEEIQVSFDIYLDDLTAITGLPSPSIELYNETIILLNALSTSFNDYVNESKNESERLVADGVEANTKLEDLKIKIVGDKQGITLDDLADETNELDDGILEVYYIITQLQRELIKLQGLSRYSSNTQKVKIFDGEESEVTDEDFLVETDEFSDNSVIEREYLYYIVKEFDTLFSISFYFYGNYNNASIIGEVNDTTNRDFLDDGMVGQSLKIPIMNESTTLGKDNNLVYSKITQRTSMVQRQKRVLGTDLKLTFNRGIYVDGTGDLGMIYAEDCYAENIKDRLSFLQGTLWQLHPEWGMPSGVGDVPAELIVLKLKGFVESQVMSDPRTQYAYVKEDEIEIVGDQLKFYLLTKTLTGSENLINLADVIPETIL